MDTIKAVVQKVVRKGEHGPFVVATSNQIEGSITFSLEPTVWQEDEWPEEGTMVFLGKLRQKRAGWRAKMGRFWKPSDEQTQQAERSKAMQFLYPISRQFPFDEVCEQIVRELEKRNWQVPGIKVDFHDYGSGDQKFRMVNYVRGKDFNLWFCRVQRTMSGGRWNNIAAVSSINIPKKELHVYDDESGPTFYLYVGNNWARDREEFVNGSKVNSKLQGKRRTYLQYEGMVRGRRSPLLVHTNDLGREYEPQRGRWNWLKWCREPDDPKRFITQDVMNEFTEYLNKVVLAQILSCPIPTDKIDVSAPAAAIPFPQLVILGELFTFGEYRDAERIKKGKEDPSSLEAADRYGLSGGGRRLVPLDVPNDGTVPEIAYDGFCWCGIASILVEIPIESLEIPGHYRWSDSERFVIRIKPNRANDIYIADHALYEKRRNQLSEAMEKERDRFTDAEMADMICARGRTIVPISEYRGGYEKPVILVNRELSFNEVEVVSGPHKDRYGH